MHFAVGTNLCDESAEKEICVILNGAMAAFSISGARHLAKYINEIADLLENERSGKKK
jgi:hypothetical protein